MRNPTHREATLQIAETIQVLDDEAELAHERRVLEVLVEVRIGFCKE
jgi:hypothetical protein